MKIRAFYLFYVRIIYFVFIVETMIEDAGQIIEEQKLQKERATMNKSVADLPYTGECQDLTFDDLKLE